MVVPVALSEALVAVELDTSKAQLPEVLQVRLDTLELRALLQLPEQPVLDSPETQATPLQAEVAVAVVPVVVLLTLVDQVEQEFLQAAVVVHHHQEPAVLAEAAW